MWTQYTSNEVVPNWRTQLHRFRAPYCVHKYASAPKSKMAPNLVSTCAGLFSQNSDFAYIENGRLAKYCAPKTIPPPANAAHCMARSIFSGRTVRRILPALMPKTRYAAQGKKPKKL